MVKRILGMVNKEVLSIHSAAYFLAFFTFLSQILGLLRDRMLANIFGASHNLDIYYASFKIPDFIFVAIGSFISVSIIIPFIQEKINEGHVKAREFIDNIFSIFFVVIIFVSVLFFFLMPILVKVFFGSLDIFSQNQIVVLSRVLLLSPIFLGISNLLSSITQVNRRFILYAFCPIIYNLSILIGLILFEPIWGINGIVFGAVLGSVLHGLIQVPFIKKIDLLPRFTLGISFKKIREILIIALPRTFTMMVGSFSVIILVALASKMSMGSIAVFNLAFNLQSVPMTIIGISYSMAVFPLLSKLFIDHDKKKFLDTVISTLRHVIFLSLPIVALFIVLRAQIVRVVLGSGNFSWDDTRLTAACLALFSASAAAQSMVMIFVRSYYASGNTKKPLFVNTLSSVVIMLSPVLFNYLFWVFPNWLDFFAYLFKVKGIVGNEVLSLPLGYTIGSIVNVLLFIIIFNRDYKGFWQGIRLTLIHSLIASFIVGLVTYASLNIFDDFFDINHLSGIFLQGLFSGVVGIIVVVQVLKLIGNKEIFEIGRILQRKINKDNLVLQEDQNI